MISYIEKSITDLDESIYICHQCNCESTYPYGLAKTIFDKYPNTNVYSNKKYSRLPGTITIIDHVINMYGQICPGKANKSYDSFEKRQQFFVSCLESIGEKMENLFIKYFLFFVNKFKEPTVL